MSETTPNLNLPYILAAQAQKHVTHNEAVRGLDALTQLTIVDKDLTAPPASPTDGERYIVASPATGNWAGRETNIAAFQDGAWAYYPPKQGWTGWVADEDSQYVFDGTSWAPLAGGGAVTINPTPLVGVNATADTTNRLSVSSPASLFDHEGDDHQLKINKSAVANNASVIFQTGYSGRAEFGLAGDDDFHMKVSPDGSTFYEGIVIDKDTGEVSFPNTSFGPGAGDEWGDAVDADIVPDADGTRDLGATATRFAETYTDALFVTDNITVGGTVDGRDVAADGTKLDNIETAATADQTGAEIKALYEAESDTNAFTDADHTKLDGIETGATADQTGAEIKTAYEAEADTNAFTDAEKSKLTGIEASADVPDETNVIAALNGAALTAVTVATDDKIIIHDTSDSDNTKTVTAQAIADLGAGNTDEEIQDIVGAMLTGNTETRITVTYEDADGTIDFVVDDDLANYDNSNSGFLTSVDASDISVTSEARGDILFRGASGWERLATGTSGQFLKSLGPGGDPIWDTLAGGGDMLTSNNLSDVASAAAAFANIKQNASTSATGVVELATAAEYRDNTSGKALTTDQVWSAMAEVPLTDAASIALDMSSGFDFTVTLAGNRTLANPTNAMVGKRGRIRVLQDGTGSRTLSYGTNYEFIGGAAPTLTTGAAAEDILYYDVISATRILISPALDIS